MYSLGMISRSRLSGVHKDLVRVVERAISLSTIDFTVTEGLRTVARQEQLIKAGASEIVDARKGRHVTGHAVDLGALIDGTVRWDWPLYLKLAEAVRAAATELDARVVWGGHWKCLNDTTGPILAAHLHKKFPDGPHFELERRSYP